MLILSIETSCDETAVALVKAGKGGFFVVDEYVSSQFKTHAPFGGIVPNLAAREHLKNLPILLKKIVKKNKIDAKNIDLVAVTEGPGLIHALLIGTNAAKTLSYVWKKPLVGVNHVAGHIYANLLQGSTFSLSAKASNSSRSNLSIKFPILTLIVSGGHTELILMRRHMDFKIIGQTLDDAAGEAFDKAAKIMKLGYPGGPKISKIADSYKGSTFSSPDVTSGDSSRLNLELPRPMISSNSFDFSFSGLKTAVLFTIRDNPKILRSKKLIAELCAEFQQAVIDVLVSKTLRAAKRYKPKTILLGGSVSANKELRKQLGKVVKYQIPDAKYQVPNTKYSLDNASMIAVAGYFRWKLSKNKKSFYNNWRTLEADANLRL